MLYIRRIQGISTPEHIGHPVNKGHDFTGFSNSWYGRSFLKKMREKRITMHGFHNILIFSCFKIPLERLQKLKREIILW